MTQAQDMTVRRIVVVMPNWVGDAVMATPLLRALRAAHPQAHIAALHVPVVAAVVSGLPWLNEAREYQKHEAGAAVRWLREGRFDVGVLLPNSFRSAWMLWRGGARRRVGYRREGRGWLLTAAAEPVHRSAAQRDQDRRKRAAIREAGGRAGAIGSAYEPVPTIDYYLALGRLLGARTDERRMELGIAEAERAEGQRALAEAGVASDEHLVVMVPGANFGASKCWPAERFARVADLLMDRQGAAGDFQATVLLAGAPAERETIAAIRNASLLAPRGRLISLLDCNGGKGTSLGAIKEIVRRSRLMVCNDTGPRHFAAALGVPAVTLFGPTDPVWAETFSVLERAVRVDVPCGPCQLKVCPIDHRCMERLSVEMVMEPARELWGLAQAHADDADVDPRHDVPG